MAQRALGFKNALAHREVGHRIMRTLRKHRNRTEKEENGLPHHESISPPPSLRIGPIDLWRIQHRPPLQFAEALATAYGNSRFQAFTVMLPATHPKPTIRAEGFFC